MLSTRVRVGIAAGVVSSLVATTIGAATASSAAPSPAAGVKHAASLVAQYTALPKFVSPGPSLSAKKLAGKTIFSLPSSSANIFVNTTDKAMANLAKSVGLKYQTYTNQGQTAQYVQGMTTAISRKADVISLLDGTDPRLIAPQIAQAKAAGIPVVDAHDLDLTQKAYPNVAAMVDMNAVLAGKIVAASVIEQTKGNADVLIITSNNYSNSGPVAAGLKAEFAADCPKCKLSFTNVNGVDWATKIQPVVQSAIARDSHLNFVVPVFDSMLQNVVPAVRTANAVGRVHAGSYNGTPAILDLIRTSKIVTVDVGENPADIGAAALDQCMRVLLHMKPSPDEHLVLRAFTADNIEQAGVPAKVGAGYGSAWLEGYRHVWGLE
jgi:ribose transport system substrate-binding protein